MRQRNLQVRPVSCKFIGKLCWMLLHWNALAECAYKWPKVRRATCAVFAWYFVVCNDWVKRSTISLNLLMKHGVNTKIKQKMCKPPGSLSTLSLYFFTKQLFGISENSRSFICCMCIKLKSVCPSVEISISSWPVPWYLIIVAMLPLYFGWNDLT